MTETLDLDLVKVFKRKKYYDKYYPLIDPYILNSEAKVILRGYEEYYTQHSEDINYTTFVPWFFNTLHRNWMPDEIKYFKQIFKHVTELKEKDIEVTLTAMRQAVLWDELKKSKNTTFDLEEMTQILEKYKKNLKSVNKSVAYLTLDEAFCDDPLEGGYKWRLKEIQHAWGNIRPEQFYLVTAATHTGKSSFIASEALYFMKQMDSGSILYFNNERSEKAVFERFMCGLFNKDIVSIRNNKEKVKELYIKKYPHEPLKIISARSEEKPKQKITAACSLYNPRLVIIDQIDNILTEKERNYVRPYEKLYPWVRDLAIKYKVPVIGATQYGVQKDGEGQVINRKMNQHGTFGSTTDKAAHCDFMLGVQNIGDANTQKRIALIRAKEGDEGRSFVCNFNKKTGLYTNI